MDLNEIMQQKNFVVVGDTVKTTKYAAKIKNGLLEKGYTVASVGKELKSINDVAFDIDIIDLCINANEGLRLLKENKKKFKCIVIQPGADNDELLSWLNEQQIPYIQGCLLLGLAAYHS
jgi:predicted CoA-binding protein